MTRRLSFLAEKVVLTVGLWFSFAVGYTATNQWNATRETSQIGLSLDRALPFVPAWEAVYSFVYIFVLLPLPLSAHPTHFRRLALAFASLMLVSYALFILFPVSIDRPDLDLHGDGFWVWTVRLNYTLDQPTNCWPSLHIGTAYLAAFATWRLTRPIGAVAFVIATAIAIATLLVKQHYLLDVVTGLLLALAADRIFLAGVRYEPLEGATPP